MRAPIFFVALLLGSAGCSDKPSPPRKMPKQAAERSSEAAPAEPLEGGVRVEIGNPSAVRCVRTLCIAGPGEITDGPNLDLGELCRRAPGVLRRCEGDRCRSLWTLSEWQQGLEALIGSLDFDGDGQVGEGDHVCRINLAGWSRGAVIAAEQIPASLRADRRIPERRAVVDHLLAIVPWAPEHAHIEVAANVRKAWFYRHSRIPEHDCSLEFEGGPWLSPPPVCGPDTQCWDYDYSAEPLLAFVGRRGARGGAEVGHCNIVALVAKIGLDNLARGIEAPHEHVPPYSNGEHGGRIVDGPPVPDPIELLPSPPDPD